MLHPTVPANARPLLHRVAAVIALVAAVWALPASAQQWPTRYVTLIVAGSAGSAPDVVARIMANDLSQRLGQQFIVDNKIGAAGNLGTEAAARATPDGYTFLFGQAAPLALNQHVFKDLRFDVEKDFDPVIFVGLSPIMIAAAPKSEIRSLDGLIAKAKAAPGKISYGTPSSKNIPHLTGAVLSSKARIDLLHVPYRTNPQLVADAISGTVDLIIDGVPVIMPQAKSNALIPLAVAARKRLPGLEQFPAASEFFPGFDTSGWFAVLAPHGAPEAIVKRLHAELHAILKKPDIIARLQELGVYPDPENTTPDQLRAYMRAQSTLYGQIVREAGIVAE